MPPHAHASCARDLRLPMLTAFVLCAIVWAAPSAAHAYREPNTMGEAGCLTCHMMDSDGVMRDNPSGGVCVDCHGGPLEPSATGQGYEPTNPSGPHGGYTTTTRKCAACHSVHDAPADSILLLPAATIVGTCETCHDGTGGWGVYGTLAARGVEVGGGHSVELTNVIPGGDPLTGGESTGSFSGAGATLICTDCHSPHGADIVEPFLGERRRLRQGTAAPVSTRLLRREPTGAPASVGEYGSDWCLACHAGRGSGGTIHNHPVESAVTWPNESTRFIYRRLAVLDSGTSTNGTIVGALGGTAAPLGEISAHQTGFVNTTGNRGYMMPWPRTTGAGGQSGHLPICQQCHEDSRDLGDLAADGSAAVVAFSGTNADSVVWNGSAWVTTTEGNPRFQNFPHETQNAYMLVETHDDLCLNCHPAAQLP